MKKFLIVIFVLLVCIVGGATIFIATFDLNHYRPLILKQIKSATGKEARIGRIALTWKDGLAARVDGLQLFETGETEPDASLDRVLVRLQLEPLLKKEIRVSGVWLSGLKLVVERSAGGDVSVAGIKPDSAQPEEVRSSSNPLRSPHGTSSGPMFSVDSIKIENTHIHFIDRSSSSPIDLSVTDLDAEVKNVSLAGPVSFTARAAVFGSKQNMAVEGRVTPPQDNAPALLEHFTLQVDLGAVDLEMLSNSLPAVRAAGLRSPLGGMLDVKVDRLLMDPAEMARAKAAVTLTGGTLSLASVPLPLEAIQFEASLQSGNVQVRDFSARFADGSLHFEGTIKDISGTAASAFRVSARDLSIGKLAQAASARLPAGRQAPRLEGHVSLDFEGRGQGLSGESLKQSLAGQGRLSIKDGVLMNSNILRTIVDKLSQVPGIGRAAISRIPPQYLQKINEPNTVLRPFEAPFAVGQGRLFFERLQIPTDLFVLAGSGSMGFDKSLAMQTAIVFDPGFSRALMAAAPPTQHFANPNGSLEIQASIQGTPPNVQVVPNLDAALQRVGQQVVTDFLQKKDPKDILSGLLSGGGALQSAGQAPSGGIPLEPEPGTQSADSPTEEDPLMALLSKALRKNE